MDMPYAAIAQAEHRLREQAYRRALGDPEQAWLAEAELNRSPIAVDLRGLSRALGAVAMALFRLV